MLLNESRRAKTMMISSANGNPLRLRNKTAVSPSSMMVVTAGRKAYPREDWGYAVPLCMLAP